MVPPTKDNKAVVLLVSNRTINAIPAIIVSIERFLKLLRAIETANNAPNAMLMPKRYFDGNIPVNRPPPELISLTMLRNPRIEKIIAHISIWALGE